jgi:hypothetical protein
VAIFDITNLALFILFSSNASSNMPGRSPSYSWYYTTSTFMVFPFTRHAVRSRSLDGQTQEYVSSFSGVFEFCIPFQSKCRSLPPPPPLFLYCLLYHVLPLSSLFAAETTAPAPVTSRIRSYIAGLFGFQYPYRCQRETYILPGAGENAMFVVGQVSRTPDNQLLLSPVPDTCHIPTIVSLGSEAAFVKRTSQDASAYWNGAILLSFPAAYCLYKGFLQRS